MLRQGGPCLTLDVGDTAIRGKARMTMLNHPEVVVDRDTGPIQVAATGSSSTGECEAVDASHGPKV